MKNKLKRGPFLGTLLVLSALVIVTVVIVIGLFYYIFSIPEPEGLSLASWPDTFTDNFSIWMENDNGAVRVRETGLNRLDEYGLWMQVVDDAGREIFSHNKPAGCPSDYSASELIALGTGKYQNGNTIFVSSFEDAGQTWSYLIGFPYAVGKYMLYYNGENVARLSPIAKTVILLAFIGLVLFGFAYAFWLSRKLQAITGGIRNLSFRTYKPLKETGVFSEIFRALNRMDVEIRHSDRVQKETDRTRREWIANITHDLKTPLSPIKGYAELLADGEGVQKQTAQEYGGIILKNVNHVEKLMNDLKLTYQLDSGAVPYHPKKVLITRYLKEVIIDIVNDPAFSNREITFESDRQELAVCIDPDLFRRAVGNMIMNALVHNPPDTKVAIAVEAASAGGVFILIRDNGTGMSGSSQAELFNRYYRGTNTEERPEGSGLGLAIAKQIITLHGGDITVKSKLGEGTEFSVFLPFENEKLSSN